VSMIPTDAVPGVPASATSTAAVRPVSLGWMGWLIRFSIAALLFETLTGLAITFLPFHPALQWGVLLHTAIGAVMLVLTTSS